MPEISVTVNTKQVSHTNLCHGDNLGNSWSCCRTCSHVIIPHSSILRNTTDDADGLGARGEGSDRAMVAVEADDARWTTGQALSLHESCNIQVLHTSRSHSVH